MNEILIVYLGILYQYPNPDNLDTVYKDNSDSCYKFRGIEVKCPKEENKISRYNKKFKKNNKFKPIFSLSLYFTTKLYSNL